MTDQPPNIPLAIMRRVETKLDRVIDDLQDLKIRMTAVEEAVNGVNRRLDRHDIRLDRIERRLDLTEVVGG
jgi:predicted  nucleic acid-binding Zn-ribbon protein